MAQNGGRGHQHHLHQQQQQLPGRIVFGPEVASIFGRRTGPAGAPLLPVSATTTTTATATATGIPFLPVTMATSSSLLQQQRRPEVAVNNGRDLISLSQPRPGIARVRNEYIETPLRPPPPLLLPHPTASSSSTTSSSLSPQCSLLLSPSSKAKANVIAKSAIGPIGVHSHRRPPPPPPSPPQSSTSTSTSSSNVVHQNPIRELIQLPQSRSSLNSGSNTRSSSNNNNNTLSKKKNGCGGGGDDIVVVDFSSDLVKGNNGNVSATVARHPSSPTATLQQPQMRQFEPLQLRQMSLLQHQDSIICRDCRRCKCVACASPRPLPAAWICRDRYQCSAETLLDQFTCMCCVKGVFYHATSDDMDGDDGLADCADRPCSCHPHRRCARWSCVALLTVALPCLLCYWPMRGCLRLCEWCYAEYSSRHACQCARRKSLNATVASTDINTTGTTTTTTTTSNATVASVITVPPGGGGSTKLLLHQQYDEEQDRLRLG